MPTAASTPRTAETDKNGKARFEGAPPGDYIIATTPNSPTGAKVKVPEGREVQVDFEQP